MSLVYLLHIYHTFVLLHFYSFSSSHSSIITVPCIKSIFLLCLLSGLTQAVKDSQISLQECERRMVDFIKKHTDKGKNCLAGNSVHADKEFLKKYMPNFMEHLHYRIIDVSTVKELTRRWYPKEFGAAPKKTFSHRALQDIKESIEELRYYRDSVFK